MIIVKNVSDVSTSTKKDTMKKKIAVLASGRGSNFQAVIDAIQDGKIPATCAALITDNPKALAIERAKKAKIPVTVIDYASFSSREMYQRVHRLPRIVGGRRRACSPAPPEVIRRAMPPSGPPRQPDVPESSSPARQCRSGALRSR
jgi:predicted aconitase with swiveling domain